MGLADRIVILREGRQMGTVERERFSDELILKYATAVETGRAEVHQQPMDTLRP